MGSLSDAGQPEVAFFFSFLDGGLVQIFSQIVYLRVNTLSDEILYRQGILRGKISHSRLTSSAHKRLCVSSLLMLLIFSLQLLQNQREMEEMKKSWQERLSEQEAANKVGRVYPFHHEFACVASVSGRFRSKERERRVKDRAKSGASERAGRHGQNRKSRSSVFLCPETKRKRLLRRLIMSLTRKSGKKLG